MTTFKKSHKRKLSSLVKQQVPEYVLSDHPKFTEFLKAYYLFMESAELQLDTIRMQDSVEMNSEFRIHWPRGELGALPDDAVQDLNIEYLQKEMDQLQKEFDEHMKQHNIKNKKLGD